MSHSHTLDSDEEREREEDLLKEEIRGNDFKNRLETITELGIENGIQREVMKKWMREMRDTFMSRERANYELYHDEGWEKVDGMFTSMQLDLNHGNPITEGRIVQSILPKFQAESLLESIKFLYPRLSHANSSVFTPLDRTSLPAPAFTSHEHVQKEPQYDSYPAMIAGNTARARAHVHSARTPTSTTWRPFTGGSSQLRPKKKIK